MKRYAKRLFGVLFALIMCVSMVSLTAFAAEPSEASVADGFELETVQEATAAESGILQVTYSLCGYEETVKTPATGGC